MLHEHLTKSSPDAQPLLVDVRPPHEFSIASLPGEQCLHLWVQVCLLAAPLSWQLNIWPSVNNTCRRHQCAVEAAAEQNGRGQGSRTDSFGRPRDAPCCCDLPPRKQLAGKPTDCECRLRLCPCPACSPAEMGCEFPPRGPYLLRPFLVGTLSLYHCCQLAVQQLRDAGISSALDVRNGLVGWQRHVDPGFPMY